MAINVLDVRDTFAPRVRVPALRLVASASTASAGRLPLTALVAGLIGIFEALGLLAVAVTGIDEVLTSPARPAGWVITVGLTVLAGWVVAAAGSGAALIEAGGRRLFTGVALAETVVVAGLLAVATITPVFTPPPGVPLPVLGLLLLTVPVAKLLLAAAPSARLWVAAGPRPRERRPDPVAAHRLLATLTLGVIGASLAAVAVLAPVQGSDSGPGSAASSVVYTNG